MESPEQAESSLSMDSTFQKELGKTEHNKYSNFILASFYLIKARLWIKFVSYQRISEKLKLLSDNTTSSVSEDSIATSITRAINRATRYVPGRHTCLPRAIAGKLLCNKRRILASLVLGANINPEESLVAHAWLERNGRILIGSKHRPKFKQVMRID